MKKCDNSKIHISSNFMLPICLLITLDALFLRPSLHCNTLLHFTTLIDTSLPLIWFNPSTFPTALFHLTSPNQTQHCSPIFKLISKIMNPFTALKNLSPFHFTSLFISFFFTYPINPSLHFTLLCYSYLQLTSLHFLLFITSSCFKSNIVLQLQEMPFKAQHSRG